MLSLGLPLLIPFVTAYATPAARDANDVCSQIADAISGASNVYQPCQSPLPSTYSQAKSTLLVSIDTVRERRQALGSVEQREVNVLRGARNGR